MKKNDKKQLPQSIRDHTSSMLGGVKISEYDSIKLMGNHLFEEGSKDGADIVGMLSSPPQRREGWQYSGTIP